MLVFVIFIGIFYHTVISSKPDIFAKSNRELTDLRQSLAISDLVNGIVDVVTMMVFKFPSLVYGGFLTVLNYVNGDILHLVEIE